MLAEHWIKLLFDSTNCITLHFSKFSPNLVWIIRVHFLLFCTIFSLNSSHCFGGKKAAKDVQKCFNCNRPEDFFSRAARNRGLRMWEFCILFFLFSKTFFSNVFDSQRKKELESSDKSTNETHLLVFLGGTHQI